MLKFYLSNVHGDDHLPEDLSMLLSGIAKVFGLYLDPLLVNYAWYKADCILSTYNLRKTLS